MFTELPHRHLSPAAQSPSMSFPHLTFLAFTRSAMGDSADAPEIVQPAAIAVAMRAIKADFDRTVRASPTTAEELVLMRTPVE